MTTNKFDPYTTMHEADDFCRQAHCSWHMVDEPYAAYKICPECQHGFASKSDLRRAFRRMRLDLYEIVKKPTFQQRLHLYVDLIFVREKSIIFCPYCTHDF